MINEESIKFIFKKHKLKQKFIFDENSSDKSFASYNSSDNSIIIRINSLNLEWERLRKEGYTFSVKQFLEIIIFHEIGHSLDKDINTSNFEKVRLISEIKKCSNLKELDDLFSQLKYIILKSEHIAWNYVLLHFDYNNLKEYINDCIGTYSNFLEALYEGYKNNILKKQD